MSDHLWSAVFSVIVCNIPRCSFDTNITIMFILRALWPASCHYQPEQGKGQFNVEIRAANESYDQRMNIIGIITHF